MKLEVKNKLGEVYYSAWYNEKENWLHGTWIGYVSAEEVIEGVKQYMGTFGHMKITKTLNDSSKGEGSWDEANEWLAQNWIPQAIAGGMEKFAYVVSPDIFSAMSSEELATKIPDTAFEMRTFEALPEAEAWLRE